MQLLFSSKGGYKSAIGIMGGDSTGDSRSHDLVGECPRCSFHRLPHSIFPNHIQGIYG